MEPQPPVPAYKPPVVSIIVGICLSLVLVVVAAIIYNWSKKPTSPESAYLNPFDNVVSVVTATEYQNPFADQITPTESYANPFATPTVTQTSDVSSYVNPFAGQ